MSYFIVLTLFIFVPLLSIIQAIQAFKAEQVPHDSIKAWLLCYPAMGVMNIVYYFLQIHYFTRLISAEIEAYSFGIKKVFGIINDVKRKKGEENYMNFYCCRNKNLNYTKKEDVCSSAAIIKLDKEASKETVVKVYDKSENFKLTENQLLQCLKLARDKQKPTTVNRNRSKTEVKKTQSLTSPE